MGKCNLCGQDHHCQPQLRALCEEARLVGLVECLIAENEYLRIRCAEEGVHVAASNSLPWCPGLVAAYATRKVRPSEVDHV